MMVTSDSFLTSVICVLAFSQDDKRLNLSPQFTYHNHERNLSFTWSGQGSGDTRVFVVTTNKHKLE